MKKRWMIGGLILIFFCIVVVLSVQKIRSVNAAYELEVNSVEMGEPVCLNDYKMQINEAVVYTLDDYYERYPQVEYRREMTEEAYQYVFLISFEITKTDISAGELDPANFIFRYEDGFTMFASDEVSRLNEWTESPVLSVDEPFSMLIPYYFAEDMVNAEQRKHLDTLDYRITWGVYPVRNEIHLDGIDNWENALENASELPAKEEQPQTDAEGYAMQLEKYGMGTDNVKAPGEAAVYSDVIYDVKSARFVDSVSQIPDYSEEYQPQPDWMKAGADMPEYTEEQDICGNYSRQHNYLLAEVELTNDTDTEQVGVMQNCGIGYGEDKELISFSTDPLYVTGGLVEYEHSYSYYVPLAPGESKTVYVLYDFPLDFNLEVSQPSDPAIKEALALTLEGATFYTEEELEHVMDGMNFYFMIRSPAAGGEFKLSNKAVIYIELDLEDAQ